jgi:RimJ/RimL family protein N-acetyltransferase|tara:strand:- start:51 stop:602 length:552 start_codon:yes stop_codon:yes gene_type:complete
MAKDMEKIRLCGKRYYLETILPKDVTDKYVAWVNDPDVTRFLEVRFGKSTLASNRSFVKQFDNKVKFLFGIYTSERNVHIGTASLKINANHNIAEFGYFLGDKRYWGENAALEACSLLLEFGFNKIGLRKIWGGAYLTNISAIFNFKKMGFTQEGRFREHYLDGDTATDILFFSMFASEWNKK